MCSSATRPPLATRAEDLPRRRFTVAELERMTEAGVLPEDDRFELIGGEVVPMSPKGVRHETLKMLLNRRWAKAAPDDLEFIQETTFRLGKDTFFEPDFVVWPCGRRDAPRSAVQASENLRALNGKSVLLVVEVSDSSLAYDLGRKAGVYARFGVREMWVIDASRLTVRVHLDPDEALGRYRGVSDHGAHETVTPKFAPDLTLRLADFVW
jgi:Uma2 family endonuclease